TLFECGLQAGETRYAARVLDDDLAVDQRASGRQLRYGACNIGKLARPVEPLAREQADFAVLQACLDSIAVELDLMHPAFAARRFLAQQGKRRRNEVRQSRPRFTLRSVGFSRALLASGGAPRPLWQRAARTRRGEVCRDGCFCSRRSNLACARNVLLDAAV